MKGYSWEELRYQLIEGGWFDWENRPKTERAVRLVTEHMSKADLDLLLDRVHIIFAPGPGTRGTVIPFGDAWTPLAGYTTVVYLAPFIERYSQRRVNSIVAHEFAHVLLHRFEQPMPESGEK